MRPEVDVQVFPDADWAAETADRFEAFVTERPNARICLPTGKTVEPFYRRVSQLPGLSRLTIFLLDEFGDLPPDDRARCSSMIRRHLLDLLDVQPIVHEPATDPPDPDGYQALIEDGGLDLVIAGLGANGHIGMNEPGSPADSPTRVVDLARSTSEHAAEYGATARPAWGVTVGLGPILAAREIWLMVTGAHKREILERALEGPLTPDIPASFLRLHQNYRVLADLSAFG